MTDQQHPTPIQLQEARERLWEWAGRATIGSAPSSHEEWEELSETLLKAHRVLTALQQAEAEVKKWRSAFAEYGPKIEAVHDATATERDRALARAEQAEAERDEARGEVERLAGFTEWIISLDGHLGGRVRQTVTLTKIIEAARAALQPNPPEDTEA